MTKGEISFLLLDDEGIAKLNRTYFGKDWPTDVISFPQDDPDEPLQPSRPNLGDVAISLEMAKAQAKRYGKKLMDEMALLIVHGILHLTGYDDLKAGPRRKMRMMERKVLRRVGKI